MKQEYQAAGYQLPAVVYWNVCSRNRQFPVKKDDTGAVLVSGCSPFTFQSAVCMTTPEKYMQQVLEGGTVLSDFGVRASVQERVIR